MPMKILEDRHLEHVPGTSPLNELRRPGLGESAEIEESLLKHDATGRIVLVPQPSDSPNDPYNWPKWKKRMFTVAIVYGCGCVGATGPLLTAALTPLSKEFDVPLQRFALGLQGSTIIAIAVASLLCNALAVKIGKRPVYIMTAVGLVVSSFWAAESKSFASLSAARAVQGFCVAPMEALVPASIADIWFVHERGFHTAVFNFGVIGGINLASPIAGAIIQYSSYRTCLHAMGGAFVLQLILTVFFMPESAYHRAGALDIDTTDKSVESIAKEKADFEHAETVDASPERSATTEPKKSFFRELLPYDGYWDKTSFWRTLIRPFFLLASPVVAWCTLLFTTCVSWLIMISLTLSQILSAPPYNFSITSVGASNVSSFMASLIATVLAGPLIDGLATFMSKKNNGIFEPEFRLPIMSAYLLFTAPGFFAWGQSLHAQDPWPIPVIVSLGLINLGVQLGTTGVVTYVVDCHREQAAEAFAIMNFVKNVFAFGLTFYSNDWVAIQGVRNCFFVIGGITVAVVLTTVPMYILGKRARSWTYRHRVVTKIIDWTE